MSKRKFRPRRRRRRAAVEVSFGRLRRSLLRTPLAASTFSPALSGGQDGWDPGAWRRGTGRPARACSQYCSVLLQILQLADVMNRRPVPFVRVPVSALEVGHDPIGRGRPVSPSILIAETHLPLKVANLSVRQEPGVVVHLSRFVNVPKREIRARYERPPAGDG